MRQENEVWRSIWGRVAGVMGIADADMIEIVCLTLTCENKDEWKGRKIKQIMCIYIDSHIV